MLYLTADHGGWAKKKLLARWLMQRHINFVDLCPESPAPTDDYPLRVDVLVKYLQRRRSAQGVAICRSGVGMAITANKYPGIRAVQGWSIKVAKRSRQEENANVVTFAAEWQTLQEITRIFKTWYQTKYRSRLRYERRLRQITRVEHGG